MVVLAISLAARELGLVGFALPQIHRQTNKSWGVEFGITTGAAMWGIHIGLGFATVIQHGGFYILVLFAMVVGPVKGAVLLATYWLGRTLPIWFGGTLKEDQRDAPELLRLLLTNRTAYRHAAGSALLWAAGLALLF